MGRPGGGGLGGAELGRVRPRLHGAGRAGLGPRARAGSLPVDALGRQGRRSCSNTWPVDYEQCSSPISTRLSPPIRRNATAFLWRGIAWIRLGFFDRAIADIDRAVAVEPNYLNAIRHKALALLLAGREDEAFALYDTGVAKGFIFSRTENFIAPLLARGHRTEALLLMGVGTMAPELRDALVTKLDNPQAVIANPRALADRHAGDPEVNQATGV